MEILYEFLYTGTDSLADVGKLDKISNGKFNVKEYAGRKTFSYLNSYQGAALDGNLLKNSENVKKSFTTFLDNLKTGIGWAL